MLLPLHGVVLDVRHNIARLVYDCTKMGALSSAKLQRSCYNKRFCFTNALHLFKHFNAVFWIARVDCADNAGGKLFYMHLLRATPQKKHDEFIVAWKFHTVFEH